jgi:aryl-alcohol dehydrogenase-like predicted oxidoreductase
MKKRSLGKSGLEVSAIGLGCMGISFGYACGKVSVILILGANGQLARDKTADPSAFQADARARLG